MLEQEAPEFKVGFISLKHHYPRFISVSVLAMHHRCKCGQAAKAGCGSAVHGEPAYSAHQSCRKSLSRCQWQRRCQLPRLTLVWPPFMVTPSLPPRCSVCQRVVFCLPTSVTAGCTGRWNTLRVQRVFLWFLGLLFVGFFFFLLLRLPSRLASPCPKQPRAVCGAGCVTL